MNSFVGGFTNATCEGGRKSLNEPTDTKGTEYKRRDVLKHAAVTTGGLVVGGTAISGRATARQTGGSALTFGFNYQRRTPFKLLESPILPIPSTDISRRWSGPTCDEKSKSSLTTQPRNPLRT